MYPQLSARPCDCLGGLALDGGWHVESKLFPHPQGTGGSCSTSYRVVNTDGRVAFLKALDFISAFKGPRDIITEVADLTNAYKFEKELLEKCRDKSRIVTPIASGYVDVHRFDPINQVPYLIFDMADGDIRAKVATLQTFDLAWSIRSLHHAATGLQQLHDEHIAHQDLKPSNVLDFGKAGTKLTDLGSASYVGKESSNDKHLIPGDPSYAPPEQNYLWAYSEGFEKRFIADLYLLGNLLFFFFTGQSCATLLEYRLSQTHGGQFKHTTFENDIPVLHSAFSECLEILKPTIDVYALPITDHLIKIAKELCEPDPRLRGNPKIFGTLIPRWDLQYYISSFDLIARKAEKKLIQ